MKVLLTRLGCHRRPDRSFFYKGKQFPVCARCTGVFLGEGLALIVYPFFGCNVKYCIFFCLIMFIDWLMQYLKAIESTNIRRLITGGLSGYGLMSIEIEIILELYKLFVR